MNLLRVVYYSLLLLTIAALAAGFYLVLNGNPFDTNPTATPPANFVQRINPDLTAIPTTSAPVTPNNEPSNPTFAALLDDLNAARRDQGAVALMLNSQLSEAAAIQAQYNADAGSLNHEDANGETAAERIEAQGYEWRSVGENLLYRWDLDGHQVFRQWQASEGHNRVMMDPKFTEIGLAYVVLETGQVYYVMVLATPF